MDTPQAHPRVIQGVRRRELLQAGLAAGAMLSALPLSHPPALWGAAVGQPKRGGILRVRGVSGVMAQQDGQIAKAGADALAKILGQ